MSYENRNLTTVRSSLGPWHPYGRIALCSQPNATIYPFFNETNWVTGIRIVFSLGVLLWLFFSVAVVCDIFMCSIEKITSKTKKIYVRKPGTYPPIMQEIEVKVWNDTVANLTLMALGTSAPEILLNVVEMFTKGFKMGQLGPYTIVGSAAFNLFVITAVCIVAIPKNENRKIKAVLVYCVSSVFNILAYVWLIVTLKVVSPDEVEIWEAVVTLILFPTLVLSAYLADKYQNMVTVKQRIGSMKGTQYIPKQGLNDMTSLVEKIDPNRWRSKDVADVVLLKCLQRQTHSRGWYRIKATRTLIGGMRIQPNISRRIKTLAKRLDSPDSTEFSLPMGPPDCAIVEFATTSISVVECCGTVQVRVIRYGMLSNRVIVGYKTCNGTAEDQTDYIGTNGQLTFEPFEQIKYIAIQIIDDDIWEPDEFFYVELSIDPYFNEKAELGKISIIQVIILNDDEPGMLEFETASNLVRDTEKLARLKIMRVDGADGKVTVKWLTSDMRGDHTNIYSNKTGLIYFVSGETEQYLEIPIFPGEHEEKNRHFQVELLNPSAGAKLGKLSKTIVTIIPNKDYKGMMAKVVERTRLNLEQINIYTSDWPGQFRNAMNVNGGDLESAKPIDYVMHFITFLWKVVFAFIPPVSMGGGWPTFIISLLVIGCMTAIIADVAAHFGCLVGLPDSITAITFVALGTSMPDTFASRQAAIGEKTADSSIGNINGSNSVNVFLGLGLPWLFASLYWSRKGQAFHVPSGDVTITVLIFTLSAIIAISVILLRRSLPYFGRAELGGNVNGKYVSAAIFVCLWINYVIVSSLQSVDIVSVPSQLTDIPK